MRRTVRALCATTLATVALGAAAPAASAEVSPPPVASGDPLAGPTSESVVPDKDRWADVSAAPDKDGGSWDATPDKADGTGEGAAPDEGGGAHEGGGTSEGHGASEGAGVPDEGGVPDKGGMPDKADETSESGAPDKADGGYEGDVPEEGGETSWGGGADATGPDSEWGGDGACPSAAGGEEKKWGASCKEASPDRSREPAVENGVQAGEGGAFTDSPAALAAGGLLIAGALGAAVQRLLRRGSSWNG
ncbi:hypothetical protein [Streptomyces sporangiiformans]|uniref:Uncharacterized protein n=1 Tax=Streptomyces sporangiiformans TaxID=2315329 RepID=A0A505D074_9ACTN|nr:hypothetical protein [Streptomyces sporangiiformans]TPQ17154.1 hypothetical protein FGD71_037930 [Streptomyces sporangiiformans]